MFQDKLTTTPTWYAQFQLITQCCHFFFRVHSSPIPNPYPHNHTHTHKLHTRYKVEFRFTAQSASAGSGGGGGRAEGRATAVGVFRHREGRGRRCAGGRRSSWSASRPKAFWPSHGQTPPSFCSTCSGHCCRCNFRTRTGHCNENHINLIDIDPKKVSFGMARIVHRKKFELSNNYLIKY